MELIELSPLGRERPLDLTRTPRLERANALRIPSRLLGAHRDPRLLTQQPGQGHLFRPCAHSQPAWCDLCGDFIWGVAKKRLRCRHQAPLSPDGQQPGIQQLELLAGGGGSREAGRGAGGGH
ncbi:ras association domain-containing protein 1-like [Sceloporus undulatus]|uniref:ras association domain-containing protein 1-like n=1 Tax=Sceloporus undulatus TaxID=8520 RepID=UPI001C4B5CC6|nr:ras association domain-containing protein 1-like [Sceloporus undulatus]